MKFLGLLFFFTYVNLSSQTILSADGTGNTYELINKVFAPNYNVVETPDCAHPDFGRHISEVWDSTLNQFVFQFVVHVTPDNDRCIRTDRQRTEIKTYDKSPDKLLAIEGETVEYRWKFKLDAGFKPSKKFTHLHQLKAVGGTENSIPQIALTARKGNPDEMQLRYAEHSKSVTIKSANLAHFKGFWVECIEKVTFGEHGKYSIQIRRMLDNYKILSYQNDDIRMWKSGAEFIRPKWGIYRSLLFASDLRDEAVLFNDFSIEELVPNGFTIPTRDEIGIYPNPVSNELYIKGKESIRSVRLISLQGETIFEKALFSTDNHLSMTDIKDGIYVIELRGVHQHMDHYLIVVAH